VVLTTARGWLVLLLTALIVASVACATVPPAPPSTSPPTSSLPRATREPAPAVGRAERIEDHSAYTDEDGVTTATNAELRQRAASVTDLSWLPTRSSLTALLPGGSPNRPALLREKQRAIAANEPASQARANAVLAAEAFNRASVVVRHWLDQRDPATGLFANRRPEEGTLGWYYQDTSADLFPHLAIGTRLLFPARYGEVLAALAAERRLAPPAPQLPVDLLLPAGSLADRDADYRLFGAAEYGKDGLLPLIERLGPDPYLGRLRELTDVILAAAATPSRRGPIPARSNEVNGDVLQVLTRLYWLTGEDHYFQAADRIGRAYVEDMLSRTNWLPVHEWDFIQDEPIGRRRLRLSDHGNEIVAGLVGWHLIESVRAAPDAPAHRVTLRRMLDRMLDKGRNPDGLWYRVLAIPSGEVDQDGLSDNWGYLAQAFLSQAEVERLAPDGDQARAERYEAAARAALRALPRYAYYPWQRGEMDGYADAIEGALYLLPRLPDPAAAKWVDEQVAVLYGFQAPDGTVEDNYLDGNFVRTALLYGLSLTQGSWLESWRPDLALGATQSDRCVEFAVSADDAWEGRLRFDTPRHREVLHLPMDFPRLNEWPELFTVDAAQRYQVATDGDPPRGVSGADLLSGLPLSLTSGEAIALQVCPAS
jgi:hypothetical protein